MIQMGAKQVALLLVDRQIIPPPCTLARAERTRPSRLGSGLAMYESATSIALRCADLELVHSRTTSVANYYHWWWRTKNDEGGVKTRTPLTVHGIVHTEPHHQHHHQTLNRPQIPIHHHLTCSSTKNEISNKRPNALLTVV